jgi:molybdenum cofactor biosynthesis protein MoaC
MRRSGLELSLVGCLQKATTVRVARASCEVLVGKTAFQLIQSNQLKKGDVLSTAQLAGIMAAKHTSSLIPLCHNIFISKADVHLNLLEANFSVQVCPTKLQIYCTVP